MDSMASGSEVSVEAKQSDTLHAFVANPGSHGPSSGSDSELNSQSVSEMMASLMLNLLAKDFIPSSSLPINPIPGLNHLASPYHQMYPGVEIHGYPPSSSLPINPIPGLNHLAPPYHQMYPGVEIHGYHPSSSLPINPIPGLNHLAPPYHQMYPGVEIQGYPNQHSSWKNHYKNESPEVRYRTLRTVFVTNIDNNVTEEQLAEHFSNQGQVMHCRICGNPYSTLRFGFIEFADRNSAQASLNLSGVKLGNSEIRVVRSKTAIIPVNPSYFPQSEDEIEKCARTVCCTNIDNQVSRAEVKHFFETRCGEVSVMRHLRDGNHAKAMAFIEFVTAECAIRALYCCGELLGMYQIRVNASKTPVTSRSRRSFT